jgi:hypothetical protein
MSRCVRASRVLALAMAIASFAAPPSIHAREPATDADAARVELDAGLAAYERKDFAQAQLHFERAHGLDPTPASLYAWAQAARGAGDCATAVGLYRRFIDEGASGDSREAAEKNEARCREILAQQPAPTTVEPQPAAAPAPAPVVDTAPSEPSPRARRRKPDAAGIALVSVGAAAVVAGAVCLGVGEGLRSKQASTRDYDEFDELDGRIDALHIAGGVTLGVGVVLAVVGAVRLGLARRRDQHVWLAPRFGRSTGTLVLGVAPTR